MHELLLRALGVASFAVTQSVESWTWSQVLGWSAFILAALELVSFLVMNVTSVLSRRPLIVRRGKHLDELRAKVSPSHLNAVSPYWCERPLLSPASVPFLIICAQHWLLPAPVCCLAPALARDSHPQTTNVLRVSRCWSTCRISPSFRSTS